MEKDSSALISTEGRRVAANKQKGAKNCKTITGAPCVAAQRTPTAIKHDICEDETRVTDGRRFRRAADRRRARPAVGGVRL